MKIPVIINGTKVVLSADPSEKLLNVLRREKFYSVKCGCEIGMCGNCTVLLDGKPVPSCITYMATVRDSKIETLEYIKQNPIYQDIMAGFNQANLHLCGYCNSGKILIAYQILNEYYRPDVSIIKDAIKTLSPCCTDKDSLVNGILYAIAAKHKREGKNQNGNKK